MAENTTKTVRVVGGAAESLLTGVKTRKRRSKKQVTEEEPISNQRITVKKGGAMVVTPAPLVTAAPAPAVAAPPASQAQQQGGAKVILDKKKDKPLILSPPKKSGPLPVLVKKLPVKSKTLKVARRIRVSVDGLNKKLNRAKTIKKDSEKMPIDALKKELVASGLVKSESKAPESILRQIYSDFQVLKQKAL
jgi:hypothetical protein